MINLLKEVNDTETIFSITQDPSLPLTNGLLLFDLEQITYTDNYMGTLYGIVRGANSTTPVAHDVGTIGSLVDYFSAPSSGGVTFPILASDGDTTNPSYSFTSNSGTGISLTSALGSNTVSISSDGVDVVDFQSTYTTLNTNCEINSDGVVNNPTLIVGTGVSGLYAPTPESTGIVTSHSSPFNDPQEVGRFDHSTTSGDTRFLLWDVDSGTLQRVSVGVADSGGTGFKVLRIPN